MSKGQFVRSLKNFTNGYSSAEVQTRNATSNESWGPSAKQLQEVALLTYHERYVHDVLATLEKRLNDNGKRWRHVMKALSLLLFLVYEGSDTVIDWLRSHIHLVKTLREFRYADSRNIDQGAQIRAKARVLTELIENPTRLANEKANYVRIRQSMATPGILDASDPAGHHNHRATVDLGSREATPRSAVSAEPRASYNQGRYSLSLLQAIDEEEHVGLVR